MPLVFPRDPDKILLTHSQRNHHRSHLAWVVHKAVQINVLLLVIKYYDENWPVVTLSNNLSVIANTRITTLETYDFDDFT